MQNEFQIDELIIRYLSDETSTEESNAIIYWINLSNENRTYFEQIQSVWILASANQIIERIDVDAEWLSIRGRMLPGQTDLTNQEFLSQGEKAAAQNGAAESNEVVTLLKESTKKIPHELVIVDDGTNEEQTWKDEDKSAYRSSLYKFLFASAAAASVIGIMILAYVWDSNRAQDTIDITRNNTPTLDVLVSVLRHEENNSGQTRQLVLPDGSKVSLFHNSTLEFHEPFINNVRDLTVTGKAEFMVRKDSSRPFIVNSSELSTTALGTRFTVTNFKNSGNITIHLSEGKVVIQSTTSAIKKFDKKYYLLPGEELIYIKGRSTATIRRNTRSIKQTSGNTEQLQYDSLSFPKAGEGSWYMFNNQSLPQVFKKLERLYEVDITFSERELRNIYFIGRFSYSDSLVKILREIAEINDLKVSKEEGRFIIKK